MIVTLQAVRIYGSKHQYGPTPQFCPMDRPIVLENFPERTERSFIFLGTPPEPILRANKIRKAIGRVALRGLFGKAPVNEADMLIKKALGEFTDSPGDYNWYVTIVVEREADVVDASIADREYLWLDWGKAMELEKDFESYASPYIDLLATYVSTIIERIFFGEVIIDDYVFFSAPSKKSFGLPKFSPSSDVTVTNSIESLNLEELKQLLQKVATLPQNRHQWLESISHCRLAAIREKDTMKFLLSFFALELLTHELAKILYKDVVVSRHSDKESVPIPISELVPSKERLPLRAKFAIVALSLFPSSATADVKDFVRAKDVRDKLSHGELKEVAELPTSTVTVLLEKYLAGAVKFQLRM